jgi:hypothetical protein
MAPMMLTRGRGLSALSSFDAFFAFLAASLRRFSASFLP